MSAKGTPNRQRLTISRIESLSVPTGKKERILWDKENRYLGVRVRSSKKVFLYYRKLNKKPIRFTIAPVDSITIEDARKEADRISGLIAQGIDPREEKRRNVETESNIRAERERASVTFYQLWQNYMEANQDEWGTHHLANHKTALQQPGLPRKRSSKKTVAGVLWPLHNTRLPNLTPELLRAHMAKEAAKRATVTSRTFRLLRACLRWSEDQPAYAGICDVSKLIKAAGDKVKKSSNARHDVLQLEQLGAWFRGMETVNHPAIRTYLKVLLLTGARPSEIREIMWSDLDFQWNTIRIADKVEGDRIIPLTPYVKKLLLSLPKPNEWVFTTGKGSISRPAHQHGEALQAAGLPHLTLHGLRRTFKSATEWVEVPVGVVAQIMGHKPSATAEKHYTRRPVDLLRRWHTKIEAWLLEQAGIEQPSEDAQKLELVK